ncbi:MAG: 1-acyl-sn-glycerol-3-phosphate acyltransferase [Woeseiaceae bacterium]|jgi:1-acyl-sn-glycerol-3-phosphate acyltransferase
MDNGALLKKTIRNLRGLIIFSGCTVSTIFWFIPLMVFAFLKLLIPIKPLQRILTRLIMSIGEIWIDINAFLFSLVNSTKWDIRGREELGNDKWYLVIVNHQTWVDIVALQTVLNRRIPFLKFFIKQQLIWFPFLGTAWWAMDMPFMKRYSKSYLVRYPEKKGKDLAATRKSCEKFRDTPTTVINFIEGTRFTEEKQSRRASPYNNLLPPRAGGVALALNSMGDMFDGILDITMVYPTAPTKFWDMMCGEFDHVVIDIRKLPVEPWIIGSDYESDRDYRRKFHQWLTQLWQEKDERIDSLRDETA